MTAAVSQEIVSKEFDIRDEAPEEGDVSLVCKPDGTFYVYEPRGVKTKLSVSGPGCDRAQLNAMTAFRLLGVASLHEAGTADVQRVVRKVQGGL